MGAVGDEIGLEKHDVSLKPSFQHVRSASDSTYSPSQPSAFDICLDLNKIASFCLKVAHL